MPKTTPNQRPTDIRVPTGQHVIYARFVHQGTSDPVANAKYEIIDSQSGSVAASGETDAQGIIRQNVRPGTYHIHYVPGGGGGAPGGAGAPPAGGGSGGAPRPPSGAH
jgi:hypothetical protein